MNNNEQVLVNTLGHAAGVLIFGIFLHLVVRERSAARLRVSWLSLGAAVLALLWNLASLLVLLMGSGGSLIEEALAAFGFSAVSILPAVLLQLCLANRFRWIVFAAYGLSVFAVAAHVVEFAAGHPGYHRVGLSVINLGFGVLTAFAVAGIFLSDRSSARSLTSRTLATMSLFLFAMSFVHFGEGHTYEAWSEELAIHHAGIPLAMFVLLQDFRFVLADAFVRFLANGFLAGLFGFAIVLMVPGKSILIQTLTAGALLAAFAVSREYVQKFLTRIIFRQPDPEETARELRTLRSESASEEDYLRLALERTARLMSAELIEIAASGITAEDLIRPTHASELPEHRQLHERGAQVVLPVRLGHGDIRYGLLSGRKGSQPYLSEDLEVLARMAASVAAQVEEIREAEAARLAAEAELRALQAQIHPHFLFNALNTLYGVIPREAAAGRGLLLSLSEILRYILRSGKTFVPLEEEMRIVEAYLSIERLRLGDKLQVRFDVDPQALREPIPVLSIEPLVENAVKHGIAAREPGGTVTVEVKRRNGSLAVSVADSGPGFSGGRGTREGAGVGLENVSRRLKLCYGPGADVTVESSEQGSRVSFVAPCEPASAAAMR